MVKQLETDYAHEFLNDLLSHVQEHEDVVLQLDLVVLQGVDFAPKYRLVERFLLELEQERVHNLDFVLVAEEQECVLAGFDGRVVAYVVGGLW